MSKLPPPGPYIKILRAHLEDWLFDFCPVFERVAANVYMVPLSEHIGVKVGVVPFKPKGSAPSTEVFADGVLGIAHRRCGNLLRRTENISLCASLHRFQRNSWQQDWTGALQQWVSATFKELPACEQLARTVEQNTTPFLPWPERSREENTKLLLLLSDLLERVHSKDTWTRDFAGSLQARLMESPPSGLTERQEIVLVQSLAQYGLTLPAMAVP